MNPLKAYSNYCSDAVVFTEKALGKVSFKEKRAALRRLEAALKSLLSRGGKSQS